MTGDFSRQAEEMAPSLDVILADSNELLGLIEELAGWDVVVPHFDDLELREDIDRRAGGSVEAEAGDTSLRKRIRGAVELLFS